MFYVALFQNVLSFLSLEGFGPSL